MNIGQRISKEPSNGYAADRAARGSEYERRVILIQMNSDRLWECVEYREYIPHVMYSNQYGGNLEGGITR